jgi:hypothetical protein
MLETNPGVTDANPSAPAATPPISAPTPTPTPTPAASSVPPAPSGMSEVDPNAPPAFTPDWKYKVKDKEFEIEPWAREGIKDEETYKKAKRLWERSHGLDEVLQSRDQLKSQYEGVQPTVKEYNAIVKNLNEISHYYNEGDYDSFFEKLGISFEVLFNYVKSKHDRSQLAPEVQRELETARQIRVSNYNYEQRLKDLETSNQQSSIQARIQQLDSVISSKAGDIANRFNEANGGNPNAFREYVVFRAQQLSREAERVLSTDEVVDRVREDVARLLGVQSTASTTPAQPGAVGKPPVIPNVRAGAQSPVRQPPKSLDDLKNLAKNM